MTDHELLALLDREVSARSLNDRRRLEVALLGKATGYMLADYGKMSTYQMISDLIAKIESL